MKLILNHKIMKTNSLLLLISLLIISSCATREDIIYFQDEVLKSETDLSNNYEIKFKPADMLTIDISVEVQESLTPFLLSPVAQTNNNPLNSLDLNTNLRVQSYLIDVNGNIEFPVLGTLKLSGLSRVQATKLLKDKLSEYLVDPIVNIRLINFTVTVLGEVNSPGVYSVQNERISLSDALGLAGDLTIYGTRKNVMLIREIEGQKKFTSFYLSSINTLTSANYYLTQNDVIYVEPNNARIRQSSYNQNNGIIISAVATLATIAAILIDNN